jgi:hypothetical protein
VLLEFWSSGRSEERFLGFKRQSNWVQTSSGSSEKFWRFWIQREREFRKLLCR